MFKAGGGNGNHFELRVGGHHIGADVDFIGNHNIGTGEPGLGFCRGGVGVFGEGVGKIKRKRVLGQGVAV